MTSIPCTNGPPPAPSFLPPAFINGIIMNCLTHELLYIIVFISIQIHKQELYVTSTKRQKMSISRSIVEAVRSLKPPGRFLEKNPTTGRWSDIGDRKAIEKTSQALRDGAAGLRKELSEDLCDPDFLSAVFDMDTAKAKAASLVKEKVKVAKVCLDLFVAMYLCMYTCG